MEEKFKLHLGNCLDVLKDFPDECIDAVVTDPPYGLSFMGKQWDYDVPNKDIWGECLRVLKPGGNLLCFAGTRTQHRMVARVVESGFVIQDAVLWAYGCLSEDTEVLTKEGWVLYNEAIGKDIQIFNVDTKECKWETPSQWYVYQVENDVAYSLRSEDTDQIVSKGHRCLVYSDDSLNFTVADELNNNEVIPVFDEHGALHKSKVTVSEISYSGVFWCPTVSTGAFVARRNGKVFITGNSGFPKSLNIEKAVQKVAPEQASRFQGTGTSLKPAHEIVSIYTKLPGELKLHSEFKRLYYCAKASKRERNMGLDKIKEITFYIEEEIEEGTWKDQVPVAQLRVDTAQLLPRVIGAYGIQSKSVQEWSMSLFGNFTTDQFHQGMTSTTKMGTSLTTTSKILSYYQNWLIKENIPGVNLERTDGGNLAGNAEDGTISIIITKGSTVYPLGVDRAASKMRLKISVKDASSGHPTIKPLKLMEQLCQLATPKGGVILDPFMGSGTTGIAALNLGFNFVGIEMGEEYFDIAQTRIVALHGDPQQ